MGNGEEEQAASGTNDASARSKDTVAGRLKGFKILRLIRLGKMLRLLRIGRVLERASVLSQDISKLLPRFRLAFEPALNSAWLSLARVAACACVLVQLLETEALHAVHAALHPRALGNLMCLV